MAIPANPTNLRASYDWRTQTVTLNWTGAANVVTYKIQRWNSTFQVYSDLASVPGTQNYFLDDSGDDAVQYAYRILSENADGTPRFYSTPSNKVWIIDPPEAVEDLTAEANSNDSVGLNWHNVPTVRAPYDYHYIKRFSNVEPEFVQINRIAGNLAYYLDSRTEQDRVYRYRIHTSNLIAGGAYFESSQSNTVYTTPAAPTGVTVKWSGNNIDVAWTNPSTIASGFSIEHTIDGTTWDPVAVTGKVQSWRMVNAERGVPHRFRLSARTPQPTLGPVKVSATVLSPWLAAQTTPNPPEVYGPAFAASNTPFDMLYRHMPTSPDAAEAGAQLQYRNAGASTWSATVAGFTVPARPGTGVVEVRMATRTADSGWSGWSDPAQVQLRARPAPTLTSPTAGAVITGPLLPLAWTQAGQVAWEATLSLGGVQIDSMEGTTQESAAFTVEDGQTYVTSFRTFDGFLWSNPITRTNSTDFADIAKPVFVAVIDPDRSSVELTANATPVFSRIQFFRRKAGQLAVVEIGDAGTNRVLYDPLPPLRTDLEYIAVGWNSAGSSSVSDAVPVRIERQSVIINYGPGYGAVAEIECGVGAVQQNVERDVTLHMFAGATLPTEVKGTAVRNKVSATGTILKPDGILNDVNETWAEIVSFDDHWFRDFTGLSFKASLSRIGNTRGFHTSTLSLNAEEIG